ncbi:uncharacterized protein LOC120662501 [Panicum virgatum]|uniref:uncharacterized protein LOC120662501 n=1 Tax=Panicum virgatum TaxID=38727 RepID=UPI0019D680F2|nr:uncharacterized protein LOC120662501 [Panicum virgatum]
MKRSIDFWMAPKKSSKGKGVAAEPIHEEGWVANEEAAGEKNDREHSPTPSADIEAEHLKGVRSVVRKRNSSSQPTSNSPAAKMPWTSASGDDAMVRQTVPSTIVDPSKGTETTLLASSSNVDNGRNMGSQVVIVKPTRKFGMRRLALTRAPTGETEDDSAPKSVVEKPLSTPEMSGREAEDMVDAMLRNSPLPDAERSDERLPQGSGSDKLPEEEGSEKLPEGGDEKLPEDTPTGNTVGRIEDVPKKAISEVRASASQDSSGTVVPQEKLKLAFKLLGEVLGQEGGNAQDESKLNALREVSENARVREGCPSREDQEALQGQERGRVLAGLHFLKDEEACAGMRKLEEGL